MLAVCRDRVILGKYIGGEMSNRQDRKQRAIIFRERG